MGQTLNLMTHQQQQRKSKDESLYQCVGTNDVDAIKALYHQGASLEWIDKEGKTPLIIACMDSGLINVAKTLIELGANINAYRPGRHGGTPLHHAAKRGLEPTVKLLLSYGANALVRNDDCHTPLGVARIKGHLSVVRAIETHICYFSGWLREFYGPGFLEALAPQLMSRKIWVVVTPCGAANPMKPLRFELVIYPSLQDVQPRAVIAICKAKVDEPKFHQSDPTLTIFDQSTKIRYKFASGSEGDKQQLQWLYDACRGISQVMPSTAPHISASGLPTVNSNQNTEAVNANGWGNSTSAETHNGWGAVANSKANYSGWMDEPAKEDYKGWGEPNSGSNCKQNQGARTHANPTPVVQTNCSNDLAKEDYNGWGAPNSGSVSKQTQGIETHANPSSVGQTGSGICASVSTTPSAPPMPEEEAGEGPIHYPSLENSLAALHVPIAEYGGCGTSTVKDDSISSSCVICWEAPVEGACIPCGHMAGCMSCLSEIKAKKGVCPICRTEINQVIRIYAV